MDSLQTDLDSLEETMRLLLQIMKRPGNWVSITARAGVQIDRPSAGILHVLMAHKDVTWRLNDLAEQLGIEAPSVTRKTQELEQAGLIRRTKDAKDRRAVSLEVTEKGREIADKLWQARRQTISDILSGWTASERQQFTQLFAKYAHDMNAAYDHTNKTARNS